MGGKHKQAQRTKNNARPSNSGRSAEFLGNSLPQFVGFSAGKETGFSLPGFSLAPSEDLDSSIDTNFQLVLKKMSKKDATTKLKALHEFSELIKEADIETVKAVLSFWSRSYNALATDADHKVREATQSANLQVVLKAKRNLAPHLKQIVAPWFVSQYDTYPPAASAASLAFESAFPPKKIEEAVAFCQEEILNYLYDNLIVQTPQTVSSTKSLSQEEGEAKYERILISSLQGYALYLNKIPLPHIEKVVELNNKILSKGKFWGFSKHKLAPVRSAFYATIKSLLQKAPFLLDKDLGKVTNAVFSNLDESDPTVLPSVWESALLIMTAFKDPLVSKNVTSIMLPKILKVLSDGGQGNASVIYPNLLPLISNIPAAVVDIHSFYSNFFTSLRNGLKQKSTMKSKSESLAVVSAFIECLQYVTLKNHSDTALCEKLIKNHLIPLLEFSLTDKQSPHKAVFTQISMLVQYWSRNKVNPDFPNYTKFLEYLWCNVRSLFEGIMLNLEQSFDEEHISEVIDREVQFLHCLKHPAKVPKKQKVTFCEETLQVAAATCDEPASSSDDDYFHCLDNLVYKISESFIEFIQKRKCKLVLEHLLSLVKDFDNKHFFDVLGQNLKQSGLLGVYNLFYEWLSVEQLQCQALVDLIYLLFNHLSDSEKQQVLESFKKISEENCLSWCILKALSHPYCKDKYINQWLLSEQVSAFLISIVDKEINDESSPDFNNLLKLALTENENGELFISKNAVNGITEKLHNTLLKPSDYPFTIDTCASLSSYISTVIYTENLLLSYQDDLLLALFHISCNMNLDSHSLSKDTLWEVNTSWQDAITVLSSQLSHEDFTSLQNKFINVIEKEYLASSAKELNLDILNKVIINYIRAVYKSLPLKARDIFEAFFSSSFVDEWRKKIESLCISAEYLKGHLNSRSEVVNLREEIRDDDIQKYFMWGYLKASVLVSSLESEGNEYSAELDEEEIENKSVLLLDAIDGAEDLLCQLLYDVAMGSSFVNNYNASKCYVNVLDYLKLLQEKCSDIFSLQNDEYHKRLKCTLLNLTKTKSWFWCKAIHYLFTEMITDANLEDLFGEFTRCDDAEISLHLIQLFASKINYDYISSCHLDDFGKIVVLRNLVYHQEIDVQIAEVFGISERIRNQNPPKFFLENRDLNWEDVQEVLELIRLCSRYMEYQFSMSSKKYWDFAIISLESWVRNIWKMKADLDKIEIQALIIAVIDLYCQINHQIKTLKLTNPKNSLVGEWEDVFLPTVHTHVQIWLHLAESFSTKEYLPMSFMPLVQQFDNFFDNLHHRYIFKDNDGSLPKWSKFLKRGTSLLLNQNTTLQLWGYKILLALVPGLIEIDHEAVNTNTPHEKGLIFEQFRDILLQTHEIVNTMLLGFRLGEDSCRVEVFTDSFTYTLAYLLLWNILLTLCEESSTELRFQYADWLRNQGFLKDLFNNLFRLMPTEILHYNEGSKLYCPEWFTAKAPLKLSEPCTTKTLEHMVCWIYAMTLSQLPAVVRQWWSGAETKIAQVVEKITTAYVSPQLCNEELTDVAQHETKFKNMTIKVIPSVREVIAVYTVDEAQMELVITLPPNYPLGGPDVQCNRQIAGTSHKQWLMQLKKCVLHQNGRIWDGLSLWNNNLDKKFDGVEECYICFAVLHPGTYQLPRLSCQTCKKKFHSACLYKWFSTSNKSSCPICRNLF